MKTKLVKRLTLETSAEHHIPQATNIPYQPLLIKPIFSVLTHAEKQFFSNLVSQCFVKNLLGHLGGRWKSDKQVHHVRERCGEFQTHIS